MVCRQCGRECDDTLLYCGGCGAPLTDETEPEASRARKKPKIKQKRKRSFLRWIAVGTALLAIAVILFFVLRGTPAEAIRLGENEIEVKIETSFQMTYKLTPSDSDDGVHWTTSDERVATVEDGLLTAVGEGDCIITATADSGCKDLCYVRVLPPLQPQEKEATGYRRLYASTQDGEVTYHYGTEYTLSLYSDLTGHLYCPDGVWKLTWSYAGTTDQRYYFDAELSGGGRATITYDADTGHSMHGVVSILLDNGTLWSFK